MTTASEQPRRAIAITEEEATALIRESTRDRVLHIAWGSGDLLNVPGNEWAFERLAEMRGVDA